MDTLDNFGLVKAVNSAITGRRDHRAAWNRYLTLEGAARRTWRKAFTTLMLSAENLKDFKKAVGDSWEMVGPKAHKIFFDSELDAIEHVIGKSW